MWKGLIMADLLALFLYLPSKTEKNYETLIRKVNLELSDYETA
jgi:hypothetical protein